MLTASDLNAEFNNILNNALSLVSPVTGAFDFDGNTITLDAAAATQVVSSAAVSWNFTSGAKTGTPSTSGSIQRYSAQTFTDSNTSGSGTATAHVFNSIAQPTLAATNALVTTTDAATWYIANAPAAGSNETITSAWALWVDDGNTRLDGSLHLPTSGSVLNFNSGNVVLTHSSGVLTVSTGDLRVTTAGTNAASAVTVGGTQTLTNKTLTSPTIGTSPTAAGATWTSLGTVTTADINGGTLDGVTIGGSSAAAATVTTLATSDLITATKSGAGSPATQLSLVNASGNAGTGATLRLNPFTDATRYAEIQSLNDGSNNIDVRIRPSTGGTPSNEIIAAYNGVTLASASTVPLTINSESVSQPNIPCFLAYNSAGDTNQTGAGTEVTVDFDTEVFDQSGDFASDTFTAPASGRYLLTTLVTADDTTTAMSTFQLKIATSNRSYFDSSQINVESAGDDITFKLTVIADMDAADTASILFAIAGGAGDTADIATGGLATSLRTYFSGMRVA